MASRVGKAATGVADGRAADCRETHGKTDPGTGIENLLLVAGPSGSGKSTFMELLASGKLRPDLETALPVNARNWPQACANVLARTGLNLNRSGLVLHYDIANSRHGEGYHRDPALALFRAAKNVTVLTLWVDPGRIIGQRQDRRGGKSSNRLTWRRIVRRPMMNVRKRLLGIKSITKPNLYSQPGWLHRRYEQWDSFVREEALSRELIVLHAIPVNEGNDLPDFRIGSKP